MHPAQLADGIAESEARQILISAARKLQREAVSLKSEKMRMESGLAVGETFGPNNMLARGSMSLACDSLLAKHRRGLLLLCSREMCET